MVSSRSHLTLLKDPVSVPGHGHRDNRQTLPAPSRGGGRRPRSGREVGVVDSPMEKTSSVRCSRRGGHKPARAPIPSSARQVTLASPQDKGSRCWKLPGIVDPWRLTGGRRCGRAVVTGKPAGWVCTPPPGAGLPGRIFRSPHHPCRKDFFTQPRNSETNCS
jgi:hypothetical protein